MCEKYLKSRGGKSLERESGEERGERAFIFPLVFCVERAILRFTLGPKCEAFPEKDPDSS